MMLSLTFETCRPLLPRRVYPTSVGSDAIAAMSAGGGPSFRGARTHVEAHPESRPRARPPPTIAMRRSDRLQTYLDSTDNTRKMHCG